jgi:hypothetical protein
MRTLEFLRQQDWMERLNVLFPEQRTKLCMRKCWGILLGFGIRESQKSRETDGLLTHVHSKLSEIFGEAPKKVMRNPLICLKIHSDWRKVKGSFRTMSLFDYSKRRYYESLKTPPKFPALLVVNINGSILSLSLFLCFFEWFLKSLFLHFSHPLYAFFVFIYLVETDTRSILKYLELLRTIPELPSVGGLILRLNCGGGSSTSCFILYKVKPALDRFSFCIFAFIFTSMAIFP